MKNKIVIREEKTVEVEVDLCPIGEAGYTCVESNEHVWTQRIQPHTQTNPVAIWMCERFPVDEIAFNGKCSVDLGDNDIHYEYYFSWVTYSTAKPLHHKGLKILIDKAESLGLELYIISDIYNYDFPTTSIMFIRP